MARATAPGDSPSTATHTPDFSFRRIAGPDHNSEARLSHRQRCCPLRLTETPQPRTFPFEPNLGFDHSRQLVRPPQASNRGLLDRQCHCACAPAVVHLPPPDIAEDRAAKGPKPKALIRSPFRAALARKEGTVLLCLQPEFAMFRIGQHCCPNFWPTRASRGLSASG